MFAKERNVPLSKKKETFFKFLLERMETIEKLNNSFDFDNLMYHYKDTAAIEDFNDFVDTATLFGEIKSDEIKPDKEEKMDFESKLSDIKMGGKKSNNKI